MSPYLRTPEVAALCGVKPQTIREWTCTYRIPHRKLPGVRACMFIEDEIRAWIEDPTVPLDVKRGVDGARVVKPLPYTQARKDER